MSTKELQQLANRQVKMQKQIDRMEKMLEEILHNQSVIYGRMLVTRKNMLELFANESPSLTANEEKELIEQKHPVLVTGEQRKKRAH